MKGMFYSILHIYLDSGQVLNILYAHVTGHLNLFFLTSKPVCPWNHFPHRKQASFSVSFFVSLVLFLSLKSVLYWESFHEKIISLDFYIFSPTLANYGCAFLSSLDAPNPRGFLFLSSWRESFNNTNNFLRSTFSKGLARCGRTLIK